MTLEEIVKLQEPLKSIFMSELTMRWDIEYWMSYVDSYENNEIQCSEETRLGDLKKCKSELNKAKNRYFHHKAKYAEYFI